MTNLIRIDAIPLSDNDGGRAATLTERQPVRVAPPRVGAPNRRIAATNSVLGNRPAGVRLAATPARLQHHQLTRRYRQRDLAKSRHVDVPHPVGLAQVADVEYGVHGR